MKTKIVLVLAFALFINACAAPNTLQPIKTDIPAPEATLSPVQEEPLSASENLPAMATYTDEFAGFSMDYPAGWFLETSVLEHVEESLSYSISISSWDINNPPPASDRQPNGLPYKGTKFDVTVIKDATTMEAAIEEVRRSGTPILAQRDVTLANGVPAVILDIEGFAGLSHMLISILNGNVIYVTGYGDLELYEPIAMSLRTR